MPEHDGVEAVCIRNIPWALPRHPSFCIEIGDFVIKDESVERSLSLYGFYLLLLKRPEIPQDNAKVWNYFYNTRK